MYFVAPFPYNMVVKQAKNIASLKFIMEITWVLTF